MPRDLPGFYFDKEKNRYFAIKGPIPGSSRSSSSASTSSSNISAPTSVSKSKLENKPSRRAGVKSAKLLQVRELFGNVICSSKGKCNFQEEYRKIQASHPMVWKYHGTGSIGNGALEQLHVDVYMPRGLIGTDILLAGSANGSFRLYEVGEVGRQLDYGVKYMPECVWPVNTNRRESFLEVPGDIWEPAGASFHMSSSISCIKKFGKHSNSDDSPTQHVLITTLGSETSGGSVCILNASEPLDYNLTTPLLRSRMHDVTLFNSTVWTADCNSAGSLAVVGTNLGAALVDLETGVQSWVLRCKSDVLSLQFDHSGHIVLCGLRNGAIVTVDARQKSEGLSARLTTHRISHPSLGTTERQHI